MSGSSEIFQNNNNPAVDFFLQQPDKSEYENLISSFFDASDDLVFILDKNGYFHFVNQSGLNDLGYSLDELRGKHFFSITNPEEKVKLSNAFQRILQFEGLVYFDCKLTSKLGNVITYDISAKALFGRGSINGMLSVAKNITKQHLLKERYTEILVKYTETERLLSIERNRLRQRKSVLEELNRLKSEFVSNISHEMRTPLASIIGFSETISSDPEMPVGMRKEFNEIIHSEGKRLAKLINDILDISKLESGEIELQRKEIDLVSVIKNAVHHADALASEKNITLRLTVEDQEVKIIGDEERLTQVFNCLLSNAIKFTKSGGRVTVMGQSLYKEYEIIISDTGIGIAQKDLPHIFEKFYRVSKYGNEIPGAGLGLVFSKQVIDLHKGLITVESEEDKGSTFVIKLPKRN
ncbi:MAG: PAS domain-containing sensor histidine kinase [Ignavibacteriaceae bacterium]|nr:PAS domain-containing sensor histidine kinase [Ignavibacteriaceae bacterium]